MRIITGTARGVHLKTLDGEETRPTQERVKEAIFSMIQFELEGRRIFDIFAGSGQLGLEALSRGAQSALFCDLNPAATEVIKHNAQKTKLYDRCRVLRSDAMSLIRSLSGKEQFDIIFIDPPYGQEAASGILHSLIRHGLCAPSAIIITESDLREPIDVEGLDIRRHNRYGRVYITVYDKNRSEEEA